MTTLLAQAAALDAATEADARRIYGELLSRRDHPAQGDAAELKRVTAALWPHDDDTVRTARTAQHCQTLSEEAKARSEALSDAEADRLREQCRDAESQARSELVGVIDGLLAGADVPTLAALVPGIARLVAPPTVDAKALSFYVPNPFAVAAMNEGESIARRFADAGFDARQRLDASDRAKARARALRLQFPLAFRADE